MKLDDLHGVYFNIGSQKEMSFLIAYGNVMLRRGF